MIRRWLLLTFVLLVPGLTTGCVTGYLRDRAADLTDVASVDVRGLCFGLYANAGPAVVGTFCEVGYGPGQTVSFGLGGVTQRAEGYCARGWVVPIERMRSSYFSRAGRTRWSGLPAEVMAMTPYTSHPPTKGSMSAACGFIYGIGATVDVVQFCDFLGGFTGIDFLHDDVHAILRGNVEPAEKAVSNRPRENREEPVPVAACGNRCESIDLLAGQ